jgi:hypothetical protein
MATATRKPAHTQTSESELKPIHGMIIGAVLLLAVLTIVILVAIAARANSAPQAMNQAQDEQPPLVHPQSFKETVSYLATVPYPTPPRHLRTRDFREKDIQADQARYQQELQQLQGRLSACKGQQVEWKLSPIQVTRDGLRVEDSGGFGGGSVKIALRCREWNQEGTCLIPWDRLPPDFREDIPQRQAWGWETGFMYRGDVTITATIDDIRLIRYHSYEVWLKNCQVTDW